MIGAEPAFAMIVYGDRGTLVVHQPRAVREGRPITPGRVELITGEGSRELDVPPLPADERDGPTHFLSCIRRGQPVQGLCSPEVGRAVQEVLEAALLSSATGRSVTLPLAVSRQPDREGIRCANGRGTRRSTSC